jgi:multiple sugar transport system substrate-binding protein
MPEIMRSSRQPLRNWPDIGSKLTPGLDLIWTNKKTPQQALDELEPIIQPLLLGVYPDE